MTPVKGLRKALRRIKQLVNQIATDSQYDVIHAATRPAYLRIAGCEKHIRDCRKLARACSRAKQFALVIEDTDIFNTVTSIGIFAKQLIAECTDWSIKNHDIDAREWVGQEHLDDCIKAITRARRLIREAGL